MLEEPIQIIFGISHLVCLFLEIGCSRKAPGHESMLAPILPQLRHVTMPSNWWQIHTTNGETNNKTIWMEGAHHQWINAILTGTGWQHWWRYYYFLIMQQKQSWQRHEGSDGRFHGLGSKIGSKRPQKYHWKANIKGYWFGREFHCEMILINFWRWKSSS